MNERAAIADTPTAVSGEPPSQQPRSRAYSEAPFDAAEGGEEPSAREDAPVLFLSGVERYYRQGEAVLEILKGAELAVWPGQSVALVAPSGAGKSTLLHVAGLLEYPDAGEVYIDQRRHLDTQRRAAHAAAANRHRLRLPGPPSAAGILGHGERDRCRR